MAWTIEYSARARRALSKLDRTVSAQIIDYLHEVSTLDDPTIRGKALTGNLAGLWRYRVADWRIVCDINHQRFIILALDIGHRSDVYSAFSGRRAVT